MSKKQTTPNSGMPDSRTTLICDGIESTIILAMQRLRRQYNAKDASLLLRYKFMYPLAFRDAYKTYKDSLLRYKLQFAEGRNETEKKGSNRPERMEMQEMRK